MPSKRLSWQHCLSLKVSKEEGLYEENFRGENLALFKKETQKELDEKIALTNAGHVALSVTLH